MYNCVPTWFPRFTVRYIEKFLARKFLKSWASESGISCALTVQMLRHNATVINIFFCIPFLNRFVKLFILRLVPMRRFWSFWVPLWYQKLSTRYTLSLISFPNPLNRHSIGLSAGTPQKVFQCVSYPVYSLPRNGKSKSLFPFFLYSFVDL